MPKLKASEDEIRDRQVKACIAKYIELRGIDEASLAIRIGFTKRTLQNKRNQPRTFNLRELRKMCDVLKVSNEDKLSLL